MKIDNLSVTNFDRFCQYHRNGDAGVEPRTLKNICLQLNLSSYERFKLCYYYQATYQIDSAIRLFNNPLLTKREVLFRTDRRYVRCLNNFERLKEELNHQKFEQLMLCRTTSEAYNLVTQWFFFGRYAAYLFLEAFMACEPNYELKDDIVPQWEPGENYTKGALLLFTNCEYNKTRLNSLLELLKQSLNDTVFSIETSLCAWEKIRKGTRWNGYYTERLFNESQNAVHGTLIQKCML